MRTKETLGSSRESGIAFEVTADDMYVVQSNAGIEKTLEECEEILGQIDAADVEKAALWGNEIEVQTEYATWRSVASSFNSA